MRWSGFFAAVGVLLAVCLLLTAGVSAAEKTDCYRDSGADNRAMGVRGPDGRTILPGGWRIDK